MEDEYLESSESSEADEEYRKLLRDSDDLKKEEEDLENMVDSIKNSFEKLTDDKSFNEYGYVTFEDIKALIAGEDKNLIAIKAPPGTSLEIPDPEQINNLYLEYLRVN
jgi:transcription factor E2F3